MNDFIIKNYNFIVYAFEIIAALTGLFFYKKIKNTHARIFVFFLFYVVFVEIIGYLLARYRNHETLFFLKEMGIRISMWWYIIFWCIGSVTFFLYYYHGILKSRKKQLIIKITYALFLIITISYLLFNCKENKSAFIPFIQIISACSIFICITFFLMELLNSDKILDYKKSINFYISMALFAWWLVITSLAFYESYNTISDWDYVNLKRAVFLFANVFMYLTFTVGIIASKYKTSV